MASARILWSRAETVLALYLATTLQQAADSRDPLVIELSRLLHGVGNRPVAGSHRNAYGVACKVRRLGELLNGRVPRGGARMERAVFDEFAGRFDALAAEAAEARRSVTAMSNPEPSRGPVPSFGEVSGMREDGETFVYLACLRGVVLSDGRLLAKVGRSADVTRRMGELNGSLPAPVRIRWQAFATWRYRDGASAHAAEQAMLARWAAAGRSIGGEFLAVDSAGLTEIANAGPQLTGRSGRPRLPTGLAQPGSPSGQRRGRARRRG